ncbi:hypothetical protein D0Y65_003375 [Glycine soja]|uniref:Uncharacterized protein n=2 Tax=Glycine subgen. Soja TaxID=1462606 RepID=A0A0R0KUL7_SOYBN|nr:hypothetical protein D0Y65_003375 [Glycine soja]
MCGSRDYELPLLCRHSHSVQTRSLRSTKHLPLSCRHTQPHRPRQHTTEFATFCRTIRCRSRSSFVPLPSPLCPESSRRHILI